MLAQTVHYQTLFQVLEWKAVFRKDMRKDNVDHVQYNFVWNAVSYKNHIVSNVNAGSCSSSLLYFILKTRPFALLIWLEIEDGYLNWINFSVLRKWLQI